METIGLDGPLPPPEENHTQEDFIRKDLNFDLDPNDPYTKASLADHPVNEWMDILGNGQLRKKVIKPGREMSRPNRSDICVIKFVGKLEDGTVVEKEEELTVHLGDMEVIQGLDLAMALMDTEEEAVVEVESRFAYGELGRPAVSSLPQVPPNAKLIYNVTLKSVQMENIDDLGFSEKRKIGNKKKERGNWWFKRKEYSLAIQCYRRALDYLYPKGDGDANLEDQAEKEQLTDADFQALLEDTLTVHNNMAAAQLQYEAYDAALESVEHVLRCQPQNAKALFRKGKILHYKGEHSKALALLTQAAKIEPDDVSIQKELVILKQKSAKDALNEKNLYRKMLGTPKENKNKDKTVEKAEDKKAANLTWSLLGGTVAAIVGIVAYKFLS